MRRMPVSPAVVTGLTRISAGAVDDGSGDGALDPRAVASGRTSGVLWGCDLASAADPVECTVAPAARGGAVDGVLLSRRRLPADDVTVRAGVLVTTRSLAVAWPELRLALEYDGEWHAEPGQFGRDRRRLNRLTAAGWTVVFVTAAGLHDPERLLARIAEALASRCAARR
jgi:very-short-patch-repair endonuclease